jgi:cyclopropane fatty-acyl-phospholipid synthase-like methyltransferase
MTGRAIMDGKIQQHNERPAAVWSSGGKDYDQISRGIADSIEHCVMRLDPKPGARILDLSTGTGWTSRLVARRGAAVSAQTSPPICSRRREPRRKPKTCQSNIESATQRVFPSKTQRSTLSCPPAE